MSRLIHTGQALVDLTLEVPGLPRRGGNINATGSARWAGGAVNALVAAVRNGADAVHAGAHGTGPNGDLVRAALFNAGVALSDEPHDALDTGVCVVLVETTGERTFVTTRGAERRISVSSLARSGPVPGDVVLVDGYTLFPPTRDPLLDWLDTLPPDVQVVLDPGAAFCTFPPEVRARVLARTDVWTSNLAEAEEARDALDPSRRDRTLRSGPGEDIGLGTDDGPAEGLAATTACLRSALPDGAVVVVRDGAAGCSIDEGEGPVHVPGFPQTAIDTNGAGDSHTGVLLAERMAGSDWLVAARRANAAAALKVTRRGPSTSPRRDEVDAFLAARPD
jgi:sugar/nucleoside kinase (ribokinase family)